MDVIHRADRGVALATAVGLTIAVGLMCFVLAGNQWNFSTFLRLGEEVPAINEYAARLLGDVVVHPGGGHDGKYFFVQATDPYVRQPDVLASLLDQPRYRAHRMLLPVLASGFGLLPATALPMSMTLVSVVAVAVGTWAVARFAQRSGANPWLGLTFALNPGILLEIYVGGSGAVGFAAAAVSIGYLAEGRLGLASGWMTAAVLARESMLLLMAGSAAWWIWRNRRMPWLCVVPPMAAIGLWGLYVRRMLPVGRGMYDPLTTPAQGFGKALQVWAASSIDLVVGIGVILIVGAYLVRLTRRPGIFGISTVGIAAVMPFFGFLVWSHLDLPRAVAPILTAYGLMVFGADGSSICLQRKVVL